MQPLTLNQAAKAAKKSKSAILEAIKSNRMSAEKNNLNQWQIDPAELFRVYPPKPDGTGQQNQNLPPIENHHTALETLQQVKIEHLQIQVEMLKESTADLKARLDSSDQERRQLLNMLTHKPNPPDKIEPPKKRQVVNIWFLVAIAVAAIGAALFEYFKG